MIDLPPDISVEELTEALTKVEPVTAAAFLARAKWLSTRLKHQVVPWDDPDWDIFALITGRGGGKTRTAAEEVWWYAWTNPKSRCAVCAPTFNDLHNVCFNGESGLLAVMPPEIVASYKSTTQQVTLVNGSLIHGIPASEPGRFRGPQWHLFWGDEFSSWNELKEDDGKGLDETWNLIRLGMRLGHHPRMLLTTTPKPRPLLWDLYRRQGQDVIWRQASSYENLQNLAPTFRKELLQHEGTSYGRQEVYGELLNPEESGIIRRSWFKIWPSYKPIPKMHYVIQSYDVATSEKTHNDATACVTIGIFRPDEDTGFRALILDVWEEHLQYPDLREKVREDYSTQFYGEEEDEWAVGRKADLILIEDKSSGIALQQDLSRAGLPVRPYNPGKADKMQRLHIVAPLIARGLIYLPETLRALDDPGFEGLPRDWCEPFLNQLCSFPESRGDDMVDALTQSLRYLHDAHFLRIDHFPAPDLAADDFVTRTNPYAV